MTEVLRGGAGALLSVCLALAALSADAHMLNRTQVEARVDGAVLTLTLAVDLTRAFGSAETYYQTSTGERERPDEVRGIVERLAASLGVEVNGAEPRLRLDAFSWPTGPLDAFTEPWASPMTRFRFTAPLPASGAIRIRLDEAFPYERPIVFSGVAPHQRFSLWIESGRWSPALAITAGDVSSESTVAEGRAAVAWRYLEQGVLHILPKGADHLLFVFALLLAARSLRHIVLVLTCFTLAHSLTLALVVTGFLSPPPGLVELLIAASILYVAAANLWPGSANRHSLWVSVPFGLLHGMGFAGALGQLGLPADHFIIAIAAFNVGVEVAQLAVVLMFWLSVWRWHETGRYGPWVVRPASVVIGVVASLWMAERIQALV